MRIPMMSISHSDLMPISPERSDAGLSQRETVIDVRQDLSGFSCVEFIGFAPRCFWALTEGARRATGVTAQKHSASSPLLPIFSAPSAFLLTHPVSVCLAGRDFIGEEELPGHGSRAAWPVAEAGG